METILCPLVNQRDLIRAFVRALPPPLSFPKTDPADRTGVVTLDPPAPKVSSSFPVETMSKTFQKLGVSPEVASAMENAGGNT